MFVRKRFLIFSVFLVSILLITGVAWSYRSDLWSLYLVAKEREASSFPAQATTQDEVTITLTQAIASSTQTLVTLRIEVPGLPHDLEGMASFDLMSPLQPGRDLVLKGFVEQEVYTRRVQRQPGAFVLVLELPPPKHPQQPLSLEIRSLTILDAANQRTLTYEGPWRFDFQPQTVAATPQRIQLSLDETVEQDGIRIEVKDGVISEGEMLVSFRLTPEDVQLLGSPTMTCNGETWAERSRGQGQDGWQTLSFPGTPPPGTTCQLQFGAFLWFHPDDVSFQLDWDDLTKGGQQVVIRDMRYEFLPPEFTETGVVLRYRPLNDSARRFLLFTSTDSTRITDDAGREYQQTSWSLKLDPDTWTIEQHTLYISGLMEPVERLYLQTRQVGEIVDGITLDFPVPNFR